MKNKLKNRALSLLLMCVMALSVVMAMPMTVGAVDDYPYKNSNTGSVCPWNYYYRYCTSFVAFRLDKTNGITDFNNMYGGVNFGHAFTWGSAAKKIGITVDMNPAVGAVAWFDKGAFGASKDYGHVAWVSAINGDTVRIEEYNYNNAFAYGERDIPKTNVSGYIHFSDIGSPSDPLKPETPVQSSKKIYINDVETEFDSWTYDGSTWIRVTDLSFYVNGKEKQFSVKLKDGTAYFTSGEPFVPVDNNEPLPKGAAGKSPNSWSILKDSRYVKSSKYPNGKTVDFDILQVNGFAYYRIDKLADALGIPWVSKDSARVDLDAGKILPPVQSSKKIYINKVETNFDAWTFTHDYITSTWIRVTDLSFYVNGKEKQFSVKLKNGTAYFTSGEAFVPVDNNEPLPKGAAGKVPSSWSILKDSRNVNGKTVVFDILQVNGFAYYRIDKLADALGIPWVSNDYVRVDLDAGKTLTVAPTVSSIAVSKRPMKPEFIVGESIDPVDISLYVTYSDGTSKTVTSGFTISPTVLTAAGSQKITVTYEGKSATFTVNVAEPVSKPDNSTPGLLNGITLAYTVTELGVKFDWTPNNNHFGYRIYRSNISGEEGISITDFPITAKDGAYAGQYLDVNVDSDTQYYYTIRAVIAEASFDMATITITPEVLGPASEELAVLTSVIQTPKPPAIPDDPEEPKEPVLVKNFVLMTIGVDTMLVNDKVVEIDPGRGTTPIIKDGRTLTPIRVIIETMGGKVGWLESESKVTLEAYGNTLEMWIGSKQLLINGEGKEMDVVPTIINGRTMLPLRFVSENVGCEIAWIGSTQQIIIVFYTFGSE